MDGKLGASFFCLRDFEDRRNLWKIFPTLAFQLAHRYPRFREELLLVLTGGRGGNTQQAVRATLAPAPAVRLDTVPLSHTRLQT